MSRKIDYQKALLNPASEFAQPEEVPARTGLTTRQKIEILRRWEYDKSELAVAVEEEMPDGESTLLQRILIALEQLPGGIDAEHTGPTKELMALAIGIAVHCDGCVAYHTKMAHQHGATREEVAETVALAVYMGGGPAAVYGGDVLRAYDQFSAAEKGA